MDADLSLFIPPLVVLFGVWIYQYSLFRQARGIARELYSEAARDLEKRCQQDLRFRAEHGQPPDWNRYMAQAERLFEARGDRLRTLASSALAVGLFGTLASLVVTLLTFLGNHIPVEGGLLVFNTLLSLSGSFLGVLFHLCIVQGSLRKAEDTFSHWQREFEARLELYSEGHPPQPSFLPALREELGQIRESLTGALAGALAKAASGFPAVVSSLGDNVARLSQVVATQGQAMDKAMVAIAGSATVVSKAAGGLQPAAERLAAAAENLEGLPAALGGVLDRGREQWLDGLRGAQEERLSEIAAAAGRAEESARTREQQMLDGVRSLATSVGEVRDAAGGIGQELRAEVTAMAGGLGTSFGREARDVTRELAEQLDRAYRELLGNVEAHEQQWLNRIGTVVDELFARLGRSLDASLLSGLEGAGKALRSSADALVPLAERFERGHRDWGESQGQALAGWKAASEQIGGAATGLEQVNGDLHRAAAALGEGADRLAGLRQLGEQLEALLREACSREAQHQALLAGLSEQLSQCIQALAPADAPLPGAPAVPPVVVAA
jgi:hypothetical protein